MSWAATALAAVIIAAPAIGGISASRSTIRRANLPEDRQTRDVVPWSVPELHLANRLVSLESESGQPTAFMLSIHGLAADGIAEPVAVAQPVGTVGPIEGGE